MKNSITNLFVYGTLRSCFHHPVYKYISQHFISLGMAKVKGLLYNIGEYPAAIQTSADFFIAGELFELKKEGEFDFTIQQLDDYEGLNPEKGKTPLYKRETANIIYKNTFVKAWMYWYNHNITGQPILLLGNTFDYATYKSPL